MARIPSMSPVRLAFCLVLLLGSSAAALPLLATPAQAQTATQATPPGEDIDLLRRAHRYSEGVMSPFCPGRTLTDCPSPHAALLREKIKGWMMLGMTDDQIQQELLRLHGNVVLALPRTATEWTMPVLVLLSGLGVVGFALYRVTRRGAVERKHIAIPKELEKRLDAALRQHGF